MIREVAPGDWDALLAGLGVEDAYLRRASVEASALLEPSEAVFLTRRRGRAARCCVREIPGHATCATSRRRTRYGGPRRRGRRRLLGRVRGLVPRALGRLHVHPLPSAARKTSGLAPPDATLERLADAAVWRLEGDLFAGHAPQPPQQGAQGAEGRDRGGGRARARRRSTASSSCTRRPCAARARPTTTPSGRTTGRSSASSATGSSASTRRSTASWSRARSASATGRGSTTTWASPRTAAASWARPTCSSTRRRRGAGERLHRALPRAAASAGRRTRSGSSSSASATDLGREFWIGKLVNDADAYRRLAGAAETDGFFPAYRALRSG